MVSEKRLQFEGQPICLETEISNCGFAAFARYPLTEMKRLLSNLLNNAVKAFGDKTGKIIVSLGTDSEWVSLKITDNGCGIPEAKLAEVLKQGVTTKEKGSGLGLPHAIALAERLGGSLKLESTMGIGTTIHITLPRAKAPSWFVSEIIVSSKQTIAILDDDQSIHDAWDQRLSELNERLDVHHFMAIQALKEWYPQQDKAKVFFSDYELPSTETGLDALENLGLGNNAILITSHYENPAIVKRCQARGIRLLPKNLLAYVPIQLIAENKASTETRPTYQQVEKIQAIVDGMFKSWANK